VSGGALLVAGGANFPDTMPWEGGKKIWHDTVFVLEKPGGPWRKAGQLPRPLGYGVSVTHQDGIICVGGSDATRHYADTFRLRWRGGQLAIEPLPALPMPLANMSGAVVSNYLCIAGGTETPGERWATNRFFALALDDPQPAWREFEPIPGPPRLLATAAAHNGVFYLLGGVGLAPNAADGKSSRVHLREALRYRPGEGWTRLADLPKPSVAAPSPAPVVDGRILLLAGDDGSRAGFTPLDQHPGFPKSILAYDPAHNRWSESGEVPAPRATVPCVEWRGMFVVPSGEVRPGVRSPEVWSLRVENAESRRNGDTEK
jgi:N-acetylneuraminic acid mutarotase